MLRGVISISVAVLLSASALAEAPGGRARRLIETAYAEMIAGAKDAADDRQARAVARAVLAQILDYGALARAAIEVPGGAPLALSPDARQRYDALFRALLEARLTRLFRAGRAATFEILGVDVSPESCVVRTAVDDGKSRIRFDHVFRPEGERLVLTDVVIDGYSQTARYRQVFARWHRRGGEAYLLEKIAESVARADLGAADDGAP